jgi:general secretion pathway protein K
VLLSGHREILVNLFAQWGLPVNEANHLADCLYDWITPGDLKSLNGAKANEYALAGLSQAPTHQPFVSFDEVDEVMDMDLLDKARSNWKDSFTLWSAGPLNVNEAPPALIAAVFGLDPLNVGNFTDSRNGRDGVAGTSDDVPVTDLRVFQGELGISDLAMKALNSEIELSDPMRRVTATGYSRDVKSTVAVVTQLNSNPIQYLLWSNH